MPILLLFVLVVSSCSKEELEDNNSNTNNPINLEPTKATITIKNNNAAVENFSVYTMKRAKFDIYGTDPSKADLSQTTDNEGKTTFLIEEIDGLYQGTTTEPITFFVLYNTGFTDLEGNVIITKISRGYSLNKGSHIFETINLN